jgi:uncharacterized protein (TIGR00251 family)
VRARGDGDLRRKSEEVIPLRESDGAVTFAVKVHPRAKREGITGEVGEAVKLAITAPAIEGRANEAVLEFFAKLFKVARGSVTIAAGQSNRKKIVRVSGVSAAQARAALEKTD